MDFDFLSSNLQIAYPFVQNVTVGRAGSDTELAPIVAAARLRTADQRQELLSVDRIFIETSDDWATVDEAYIKFVWLTSSTVVELDYGAGNSEFVFQLYGTWLVAEWNAPTALTGSADISVKFIFPTSAIETAGPNKLVQIDKKTDDLVLEASVVNQGPGKINRVYWKRGNTLELVADRDEEIIIRAGFNMSIGQAVEVVEGFQAEEFTTQVGRQLTNISVDAVPGAGAGQYLLCPSQRRLLTLNGVSPNSQNDVILSPEDCYWMEIPIDGSITPQPEQHGITGNATLEPNSLKINNGCGPCCSCDKYLETYNHLKELWAEAKEASDQIYQARNTIGSLTGTYEERSEGYKRSYVEVQWDEDEKQAILNIGYYNDSGGELNNQDTYKRDARLRFEIYLTIPTSGTMKFNSGSGWIHTSQRRSRKNLKQLGRGSDQYEVYSSLPVPDKTTTNYTGQFEINGMNGRELTVKAYVSGGGATYWTGSTKHTFPPGANSYFNTGSQIIR